MGEALEDMQAKKLTKSICVSNFNPKQLDTVIGMGGTVPCINQLPYGVGFSGYYGGSAASVLEANRRARRGIHHADQEPLALRGGPRHLRLQAQRAGDRASLGLLSARARSLPAQLRATPKMPPRCREVSPTCPLHNKRIGCKSKK